MTRYGHKLSPQNRKTSIVSYRQRRYNIEFNIEVPCASTHEEATLLVECSVNLGGQGMSWDS